MILIAIIAALCAIASYIIAEIIEVAFFITLAKIGAVIVVICVLITLIQFVVGFFD